MSVLWMDGWDYYTSLTDRGYYNPFNCWVSSPGRYGGQFLLGQIWNQQTGRYYSPQLYGKLPKSTSYIFSGFGFLRSSSSWGDPYIIEFTDLGVGQQMVLRINGNGQLYVQRNGTTLFTADIYTILQYNQWYHVQFGFFISATAGWAELYINSVMVGSYYGTGTNRATANGNTKGLSASSTVNQFDLGVEFEVGGGSYNLCWDDLWICDNLGTTNNDFLGDIRVLTILPNGPGTFTDFSRGGSTPSATNWQSVDEAGNHNSDTDYTLSSTVNQRDTYAYQDLPSNTTAVKAVATSFVTKKDDAGTRYVAPEIYTASTEIPITASAYQPGQVYNINQIVLDNNPNTAAPWTPSEVNGAEFGLKVTA